MASGAERHCGGRGVAGGGLAKSTGEGWEVTPRRPAFRSSGRAGGSFVLESWLDKGLSEPLVGQHSGD